MEKVSTVSKSTRKALTVNLKSCTYNAKEDKWLDITEWQNGEGFDIHIFDNNNAHQFISLNTEELDAIEYLIKSLQTNIKFEDED